MRRLPLAVAAASLLAGASALPATASATEVQLGQTTTPLVAPVCPADTTAESCKILLTQMTGLATVSDGTAFPTRVKSDGVLTSMTIGVSSAANKFESGLDKPVSEKGYGGPPEAQVTVLRPVGPLTSLRFQVVAQSSPQVLHGYEGTVVQFPLGAGIPVVPGEMIALSSPTWAPVLSIELAKSSFSYRQPIIATAATAGAAPTCTQYTLSAALVIGNQNTYGCSYPGTRLQYSVSEVTTPTPTAQFRLQRQLSREHRKPRIIRRAASS
jgi:hypothetical protein